MTITVGTKNLITDTRLKKLQRILQAAGSATRKPSNNDTVRSVLVKIIQAKLGI